MNPNKLFTRPAAAVVAGLAAATPAHAEECMVIPSVESADYLAAFGKKVVKGPQIKTEVACTWDLGDGFNATASSKVGAPAKTGKVNQLDFTGGVGWSNGRTSVSATAEVFTNPRGKASADIFVSGTQRVANGKVPVDVTVNYFPVLFDDKVNNFVEAKVGTNVKLNTSGSLRGEGSVGAGMQIGGAGYNVEKVGVTYDIDDTTSAFIDARRFDPNGATGDTSVRIGVTKKF